MKTFYDIENIIKKGKIENELDFERALIAERKLRVLSKENIALKPVRKKLRNIIENYETTNWSGKTETDINKIKESDIAEFIAEKEREFIEKRKEIIKAKLKEYNLKQQELSLILGHKSKTYMSELMNGLSPFSLKDLIIISRLLKIDIKNLIPVFLSREDQDRIKTTVHKLNNPRLKLTKEDLILM